MTDLREYLAELASLAGQPEGLNDVIERALDALAELIPYDLASVLQLNGDRLSVVAARGPLADARIASHSIRLADFPTVAHALKQRRPIALTDDHHASAEGDPYDGVLDLPHGHSCMVVPLHVGEKAFGAITFDRAVCSTYSDELVRLAGVYGQIVALAIVLAEQSERLSAHNRGLVARQRLRDEDTGVTEAGRRLERAQSVKMRQLTGQAKLVANTDTAVLITGETGVGKEVLAQAIHGWSARAASPFLALNCAAIAENLVESELFGHVKGAFTGASNARVGRFQLAHGGTLLLDEVGDLSLGAQAKLLRVLQEGTLQPVGGDATITVDVRVVAATHIDLEQAVVDGRFRDDLYYRLAVFPLRVPALRERPGDIPIIAGDVLDALARRTGRGPWTVAQPATEILRSRPWPGNVRELVNALERATILSSSRVLDASVFDAAAEGRTAVFESEAVAPLVDVERAHIERALTSTSGKLFGPGGAAELLGLKPTTLQSRMKKLGIRRIQKQKP